MRPGDGAMAELCVAEEAAVLPLPDGVDDDLAAALGLSAIAAWMALTWRGGLQPGEHVLVLGRQRHGRAGGRAGGPAARGRAGHRRVPRPARPGPRRPNSAPTRSPTCRRGPTTLDAALAEAVGGQVDLVLDPVWGVPAEAALRMLSPQGRLVNLGSSAAVPGRFRVGHPAGRALSVLGYTNNALSPEQKTAALDEILAHAAAGRLTADRETLPLDRAAEGWSRCGQAPHCRAVLTP